MGGMEEAQLNHIAQLNHTEGDERLGLSSKVWKGVNEELEKEMEITTMYVCGEVQVAYLGWRTYVEDGEGKSVRQEGVRA